MNKHKARRAKRRAHHQQQTRTPPATDPLVAETRRELTSAPSRWRPALNPLVAAAIGEARKLDRHRQQRRTARAARKASR